FRRGVVSRPRGYRATAFGGLRTDGGDGQPDRDHRRSRACAVVRGPPGTRGHGVSEARAGTRARGNPHRPRHAHVEPPEARQRAGLPDRRPTPVAAHARCVRASGPDEGHGPPALRSARIPSGHAAAPRLVEREPADQSVADHAGQELDAGMTTLAPVFLSASVPDPKRHPKYYERADVTAIREAVVALART